MNHKTRIIISFSAFIAFCITFLPLYTLIGPTASAVLMLPVALTAWLLGLRAGLIAGFFSPPLITILFILVGHGSWDVLIEHRGWPGMLMLIFMGAMIGRLHDLRLAEQQETVLRKKSEERYRQLVELSPDAISLTDLEGAILAVNSQKVKQSGYDREELIGMNSFDLIVPSDRDRARKILEETLGKGIIRNVHYTLLRKDGTTYKGELNASVVEDAEGKPTGFIGVVRDITERDKRLHELEKWEKVTVDRELKMIELKKNIKELKDELDKIKGEDK